MVTIATDRLTKVFDDGTVAVDNVSIEAQSGEILVLLGPTGCGKSTILRLIAGLESVTSGHVLIDGEVVDHLGPRERGVAMVFQDYGLYPHLSVADNIGFPLRAGHEPAADAQARVAEVAAYLGLTDLLHRTPDQLSGGQRQRVAVARAIVRNPRVLLLDEPLSNVDAGVRAQLRTEVVELARRLAITTIYVTHDQSEALAMAERLVVLRRGRVEQVGPPDEVYADPATVFVAAFLGTPRPNLLKAAVYAEGPRVVLDLGSQVIELPPGDRRGRALASHHTERLTVALRADALRLVPPDSPGPVLHGTVRVVENLGHEAVVRLATDLFPTPFAESHLELPDTGQHLSQVLAKDAPTTRPIRQALARLIPHQRTDPTPPTARTEYGFYPVYEPEMGTPVHGEITLRVPVSKMPRVGEAVAVAVDLDRMLFFDRAGARIRIP